MLSNFLKKLFCKKSVDSVLSAFNKTIADLHGVHENETAKAEKKRAVAKKAADAARIAEAEAARAKSAAKKFEELVASHS